MGGCVVPPGTAAMCQTGGEEEREGVSKWEREREKEREGERERSGRQEEHG